MTKNITKKCKACELNFDKLKKTGVKKEYTIPKDFPVSETMRNSVNKLRGNK